MTPAYLRVAMILHVLIATVAAWIHRHQQQVVTYVLMLTDF
jgi:hypothetical protein